MPVIKNAGAKNLLSPELERASSGSGTLRVYAGSQPISVEQQARDMLECMGWEEAQSLSAGDVVELANMINQSSPPHEDRRNGVRAEFNNGMDTNIDLRLQPAEERRKK